MENSNENIKFGICPECKVREGDSSEKKLYQCPYCKGWFCEKHIEPKLVTTWSAIEKTKDPILKEKLYEEWRKEGGHPDSIWTMQYFENFEMKEREEREKYSKALNKIEKMEKKKINLYDKSSEKFPKEENKKSFEFSSTKNFFESNITSENIDRSVVLGLFLSFFSLFLPWFPMYLCRSPIETTLIYLLNYLIHTHYIAKTIFIFVILGLIIVNIGLLFTKNSTIFIGSLFLIISSLSFLYYLLTFGGISSIYFAGVGFWIFIIGSVLIAYGSAKKISKDEILSSLLITIIVFVFIFQILLFI
jgi:hypothetical protein